MIKEIDAVTGEITAKFGRRPQGFVAVPDLFHNIGRGTFDELTPLDITTVGSMTLVEDRYLFVSYDHPEALTREWVVYITNPTGTFEVFELDDDTSGRLRRFSGHGGVPRMGAITAAKESLYIWRPPNREAADKSIGTIEEYAVVLDRN